MILISRKEFHRRMDLDYFKAEREETVEYYVAPLWDEIKADAPFRNHEYLFNGSKFEDLPLQEDTVGIKEVFPDIKTEADRLKHIKDELLQGTYKPVPILFDKDHPTFFYVDDGFHRIFLAKQLGWKTMQIQAKYGKFKLHKTFPLTDLSSLLKMVDGLFGKKFPTVKGIINFLENKADKEKMKVTSICYGK